MYDPAVFTLGDPNAVGPYTNADMLALDQLAALAAAGEFQYWIDVWHDADTSEWCITKSRVKRGSPDASWSTSPRTERYESLAAARASIPAGFAPVSLAGLSRKDAIEVWIDWRGMDWHTGRRKGDPGFVEPPAMENAP